MVKVLPLVLSFAGAGAMLFKPNNPKNVMWDTWLFVEKNHGTSPFYLNYLSNCDASCGGPTGGMWNGVGAALSTDGVHFADEGIVIHKDPGAVWLGSGSVLKTADGEYVMNFSEEYDCEGSNCQSIFFATSKDLRTWQRLPFKPPPADDPNVFKYGDGYKVGGRWDCIATVPKPKRARPLLWLLDRHAQRRRRRWCWRDHRHKWAPLARTSPNHPGLPKRRSWQRRSAQGSLLYALWRWPSLHFQ